MLVTDATFHPEMSPLKLGLPANMPAMLTADEVVQVFKSSVYVPVAANMPSKLVTL